MGLPRASGILLHPTSLPGQFGVGDLGSTAYRFADFLASTRQRLWQVLPLGPTGYGNSPYQCLSVFAGNPLLISLQQLVDDGFLEQADLGNAPIFAENRIDYELVTKFKMPLLRKSFQVFSRRAGFADRRRFERFCRRNASWLDDYALFMALREAHGLAPWNTWEENIRRRQRECLENWNRKMEHEVLCHKYQQYQFFRQWLALKKYCNKRGVKFIGDMPIFIAHDSAEIWAHPEMFCLDANGKPTALAGVPPDYFSKTGQLWGNPLYRWDVMEKDGYSWWIERFRKMREIVDIIRLDHFRGFEKYWQIPATEATALNGRWVPGPGAKLFNAVQKALGKVPVIAEDLGVITPEVEALREQFGFPGMRVLQFSFAVGPDAYKSRPYNYPRNCVVYTGTHDNNTTVGWFRGDDVSDSAQSREQRQREKQVALAYLGTDGREINWDFIRLALLSPADTAIIPMQDILGLGTEGRMNIPGRAEGNWCWRFTYDMLSAQIQDRLRELTTLSGR